MDGTRLRPRLDAANEEVSVVTLEARLRRRAKNAAGRARTQRRSRAKPKVGWSLAELAVLVGVSTRLARLYLERGVLPAPRFAASATRYGRTHLLRLLAARRLRSLEALDLDAIKKRIRSWTVPQLEAFATTDLAPGPLAEALQIAPSAKAVDPARPSGAVEPLDPAHSSAAAELIGVPTVPVFGERRWTRVELAVGLELHLREDASPRVVALAQRFLRIAHED